MSGKKIKKSEAKKQLIVETAEKLLQILAPLHPEMDAKKAQKRAAKAAKVLLRGTQPVIAEVAEVAEPVKEITPGNEFSAAV